MQNRALEKYVWGVSFLFCAGLLMADSASASGLATAISYGQDPRLYMAGLILTFVGAKVFGGSNAHF